MSDVFDRLIGQDRAVFAMRQYARHPVHAYLFSGPVGSSLHDAVVSFAAASPRTPVAAFAQPLFKITAPTRPLVAWR